MPDQPTATAQPTTEPAAPRKSKLANYALILAILGLLTSPIVIGIPIAFIALILGFSASSKIKKSNNTLTGKGKATTAIFASLAACTIAPTLLVFMVYPMFQSMAFNARIIYSQDVCRQLAVYAHTYQDKNNIGPTKISDIVPFSSSEQEFYTAFGEHKLTNNYNSLSDQEKANLIQVQSDFILIPQTDLTNHPNPDKQVHIFSNPLLTNNTCVIVAFVDAHTEVFKDNEVNQLFSLIQEQNNGQSWQTFLAKQRSKR